MAQSRHPFTPAVLMYAPARPGVYMLWDRDGLIFIGEACAPDTILSRLMDHYCGRSSPSRATHCSWDLTRLEGWLERFGAIGSVAIDPRPEYAESD